MFSPKNLHGHSNGTFKFVFAFVFNLLVLSTGTPPTNKGAHEHRDEMFEKQQQRQGLSTRKIKFACPTKNELIFH